jgi:hypothetical protein
VILHNAARVDQAVVSDGPSEELVPAKIEVGVWLGVEFQAPHCSKNFEILIL